MAGRKNFADKNPNFKKGNPNEVLAGDYKEAELSKSDIHAKAEQPQQNKSTAKTKQKYLRLDVTDYYNYVSLMADYFSKRNNKYVSMTQYILQLIESDKQQHRDLYEKLEQIENQKRELFI